MSGGGNKQEDVWDMLAIPFGILVIVGIIYLVYINNQTEINYIVVYSARAMLIPLSFFSSEKAMAIEQLNRTNLSQIGVGDLFNILNYSNRFYSFFLIPLSIYFVFKVLKNDIQSKYSRFFDMVTLVENNSKILPYLKPVINRDKPIIEESEFSGPWALPVKPIQWISKHQLLVDKDGQPFPKKMLLKPDGMPHESPDKTPLLSQSKKVRSSINAQLDKEKTEKLLLEQLGERLEADRSKIAHSLKDYEAGIAAALIAYGSNDKDRGYGFICTMADSFVEGDWDEQTKTASNYEIDIGDAREYITEKLSADNIDDQLELTFKIHGAYKYTWLMSLLEDYASDKYAFCSALYVGFLRPTDNRLYLALNQVGSNTGWSEAYGIWAHYEMEKVSRYSIIETDYSMKLAYSYLEKYIENQGWIGWSHTSYEK